MKTKDGHRAFRVLLLALACCFGAAVYAQKTTEPELKTEKDGFTWYKMRIGGNCQVLDADKKVIIPASRGYRTCTYQPEKKNFKVSRAEMSKEKMFFRNSYGLCRIDGTEILSPNRGYTGFTFNSHDSYYTVKKDNLVGVCDSTGRELISPDRGYTLCTKKHGFFIVSDGKSEGACDLASGREIVPLKRGYTFCNFNPARNFFHIKKGTLCGVCSADGTEIIPPEWSDCIYNTSVKKWRGKRTVNSQWEDIDAPAPVSAGRGK